MMEDDNPQQSPAYDESYSVGEPDNVPDLPPWKPIADWLARLPNVSCDEEHEDTRAPQNATQNQIRKRYEKTAKAIAYDIATNGVADE